MQDIFAFYCHPDTQMDCDDSDGEDEMSVVEESNPKMEELPSKAQVVYDLAHTSCNTKSNDIINESVYKEQRAALQGKIVPVNYAKEKTVVNWVVFDAEDQVLECNKMQDESIGLTHFNFRRHEVRDNKGRLSRVNTMQLLYTLCWPGNIKHQLLKLNGRIEKDNEGRRKGKIQLISLREFTTFLGVLVVACLEGKKGSDLWLGSSDNGEGYRSQVDMSRWMTKSRHSVIRKYFSYIFADEGIKERDPWWMVSQGIAAFNHNRKTVVCPCDRLVLDESMSAYRPRTTATGTYHCRVRSHNTTYIHTFVLTYLPPPCQYNRKPPKHFLHQPQTRAARN